MDSTLLEDGALTIEGAQDFTGLSRTRIYRLMGSGQLAYTKIGRARRIPKRALVKLLAGGLQSGGMAQQEVSADD